LSYLAPFRRYGGLLVENRQFVPTPPSFNALARDDPPSNFGMSLISPETRMMGLPYGEEIMVVGRTIWTQCTSVTDGRTDRITITETVQTASHGNNGNIYSKQESLANAKVSARQCRHLAIKC